jgi:hypothetical protein
MCDYSLFAIPNRLATEGDRLVIHRFPTGSLGLASRTDIARIELASAEASKGSFWHRVKCYLQETPSRSIPIPAVCVPPGAWLILKEIPRFMQRKYGLESEEGAEFIQTNAEADTYRDALRFHNGAQIRLQELRLGQMVEVLSLAGASAIPYERESSTAVRAAQTIYAG